MVMAMLALVLGAMGIAMRVLRKYAMTNSAAKGTVKMEIVQRLSLGQRQGLAVVRIGTRVLAVSMGDGGVHQVAELSDDDLAASPDGTKGVTAKARHSLADGFSKLSLIRGNSTKQAPANARSARTEVERIPYIAPLEDFQAVLSMALGGAHA
jgi:flagellar biogenesis protein FliO